MNLGVFWAVVLLLTFGSRSALAQAGIQGAIQNLIRTSNVQGTEFAVAVMDVDRDRMLAQINVDEMLIPASNMKLYTTAASLNILGPDFEFQTTLGLIMPAIAGQAGTGEIKSSNSDNLANPNNSASDVSLDKPSLIIVGDGDPAFGDPELLEQYDLTPQQLVDLWVQTVVDTGITHFDQILVEDRMFDRTLVHNTWPVDQLNRDYCAQVAGINFHLNCLRVRPIPADSRGQTPNVQLYPYVNFIETLNKATTGTRNSFWIARETNKNSFSFRGSVSQRGTTDYLVTIHDPPIFFAQFFAEQLNARGISVKSIRRVGIEERLTEYRPLHVVATPLQKVLNRTNQDSENMFAEALLKRIGRELTGLPGSWTNGPAAIREFLKQTLGPRASSGIRVADGSGLSRNNRINARTTVQLLNAMHEDERYREAFQSSLAEGGESGTLRRRFQDLTNENNPAAPIILGKTGYIRGVSTISGYVIIPSQPGQPGGSEPTAERTYAFSILVNDIRPPVQVNQVRKVQDKIVAAIVERYQP